MFSDDIANQLVEAAREACRHWTGMDAARTSGLRSLFGVAWPDRRDSNR